MGSRSTMWSGGPGRRVPAGCYCEAESRAAQMGTGARNDPLRAGDATRSRRSERYEAREDYSTRSERPLLGDGAMGTQLMIAGLEQGNCGEAWNLTHPERVLAIQRRYVDAGSDCLLTNTFGGSRIMLNRHSHADDVVAINAAGVGIAREAFGDRDGYVIGDIGPVRRADGAVRRVHRDAGAATRSASRPRRSSMPAPTPSSSRHRRHWRSCGSASRRHAKPAPPA